MPARVVQQARNALLGGSPHLFCAGREEHRLVVVARGAAHVPGPGQGGVGPHVLQAGTAIFTRPMTQSPVKSGETQVTESLTRSVSIQQQPGVPSTACGPANNVWSCIRMQA